MKEATVIFPHQLFDKHPALEKNRDVFITEDQLFFGDSHYPAKFHKKKLILHSASIRHYEEKLRKKGYNVKTLQYLRDPGMKKFFRDLKKKKISKIHLCDPVDYILEKRLNRGAKENRVELNIFPSPGFLCSREDIREFFRGNKHFSQTRFYISQRKRLHILVEKEKPIGGKWSFDPANRKKIPRNMKTPSVKFPKPGKRVQNAVRRINREFPGNPGKAEDFPYPVTRKQALNMFDDFLENRVALFGDYQDAIRKEDPFLFHSLLTPALNIGLVTPEEIIEKTLDFAWNNDIPMNSLEGFIRQIIGWREFMRAVYILKGSELRTSNYWDHDRPLPEIFYTAQSGIDPVDDAIGKLNEQAYVHHIERLMVLGNFMLLCEIHPDEIYRWFMEMFIDSYDWVMVPNVYGMSQNADGGLITTKPYISSSNYIRKMSDYGKGGWADVWDALYWRFIYRHRKFFESNPRMKMMTSHLDRMGKSKLEKHLKTAKEFLDKNIGKKG